MFAQHWGKAIGLRVSILASGSSGNITLLETESTRLLIDAGLGKRETLARLAAVEQSVDRLDGILITHEHNDHCSGLPQMLGLWKAPLYVTEQTMDALHRALQERLEKRLRGVETIRTGQSFTIGDIEVHPFQIPHDSADPVGFTFRAGGVKMALVTDLGKGLPAVRARPAQLSQIVMNLVTNASDALGERVPGIFLGERTMRPADWVEAAKFAGRMLKLTRRLADRLEDVLQFLREVADEKRVRSHQDEANV